MNKNKFQEFTAARDDDGRRIDKIIRKMFPTMDLKKIYSAIRKGDIRLNDKKVKQGDTVREGDVIQVYTPYAQTHVRKPFEKNLPQKEKTSIDINTHIVYENENILILNKPRGFVVHGENSLEKPVQAYLRSIIEESLSFRPGPLHRLDKYTTGVLVFGKSLLGAREFSKILHQHGCTKTYIGVVQGEVDNEIVWKEPLENNRRKLRKAETVVTPLLTAGSRSLCLFTITTGRQHQIRRHAANHGCPLVGDAEYSGSKGFGEYILHAYKIELEESNPILGFREITAPLPHKAKKKLNRWFQPHFQELPFSQ